MGEKKDNIMSCGLMKQKLGWEVGDYIKKRRMEKEKKKEED